MVSRRVVGAIGLILLFSVIAVSIPVFMDENADNEDRIITNFEANESGVIIEGQNKYIGPLLIHVNEYDSSTNEVDLIIGDRFDEGATFQLITLGAFGEQDVTLGEYTITISRVDTIMGVEYNPEMFQRTDTFKNIGPIVIILPFIIMFLLMFLMIIRGE